MAMASISVDQDQLRCPVCLDLLKDPVTTSCGHSYCMSCITGFWDQEDQKGVYSCPQCRQTFTSRPALRKNVLVAEMVEKLKKTKLQTAVPAHGYSGTGDVECDVCTGSKIKAVKSCLVCLNSYCQNHLEQHENFFKGKEHKLIDATGRLQDMICRKHDKQMEIYCRTDQQCICYLCTMDEHKNHDTVTAVAERSEKQSLLKETQKKFQQRIQEREKKLQQLREAVKSHKRSAQAAVEDSERIFTELIRSIDRRRSEVTRLIRDQEKSAVTEAEGLLQQLKQEIDDLKKRNSELEQLSHTDDHIHFLQSFKFLSVPPGSTVLSSITVSSLFSFDHVGKSVSKLKEKLEDFCKEEIKKISDRVTCIEITPKEPKTRKEFLQHSSHLSLDPNTVNKNLLLSERNRVASFTRTVQQYPDHPDRFNEFSIVLCRESVFGRCYWEVEWSGSVGVSVSYKSIFRKGRGVECRFGRNDQSWMLYCSGSRCSFCHNNKQINFPAVSSSSRIGVCVDHSAETLSFYTVCRITHKMTLIHRVQTTFTHPLYPGFWLDSGSTVKLCHLTV